MIFKSILYINDEDRIKSETAKKEVPRFFGDFNLDQIIQTIIGSKEEYNLKPFFYISLDDTDAIRYRHEIFKEIENPVLYEYIHQFASEMKEMRKHLAQEKKLSHKYQKESWFLDAAEIYCLAVNRLRRNLSELELQSRGFINFREYLEDYICSESFVSLFAEIQKIKQELHAIKYAVLIKDNRVQVRNYLSETDYSAIVAETFAKFRQGAVKNYLNVYSHSPEMNYVEEQILDCVARLNPGIFSELDTFCDTHNAYLDGIITEFDREVQFYMAYIDYVKRFREVGLKICYPNVSGSSKEIYCYEGYDLALANNFINEKSTIVVNDFHLKGEERILVVSGPNQGGKTTFARTFGQLHFLACAGCPVAGNKVQLFLYDKLFAHFEREENIKNLQGKLKEELVRIHEILEEATTNSVVVINEIFTSTSLHDQIFLSNKIMEKITALDLLCIWVTFIDELASYNEKTISMVSSVVPGNPAMRTFKIERRPADGLAFALSIAEKYRLTNKWLNERLENK